MSTVSVLPSGELIGAVKGATETIKTILSVVPEHCDGTYKCFMRRGSKVPALGFKQMRASCPPLRCVKAPAPDYPIPNLTQVNKLTRNEI